VNKTSSEIVKEHKTSTTAYTQLNFAETGGKTIGAALKAQ
jgi:hypothetical protein